MTAPTTIRPLLRAATALAPAVLSVLLLAAAPSALAATTAGASGPGRPAAAGAPSEGATSPAPGATPPPAASPEHAKLTVLRAGGDPLFTTVGERIVVRGVISSYLNGQRVTLSFRRDGRQVAERVLRLSARRDGSAHFEVPFKSHYAGSIQAQLAAHLGAGSVLRAKAPAVQYVHTELGPGSSGASVRLLQSELNRLHYALPLSGVFDEGTGRALIAFRKMTSLERIAYAGPSVFSRLAHGGGAFHVRYPHDGRHVEANLTKQVLAEIEPGGRVREIYEISSGKPSTPTVVGRFSVYLKTPGVNEKGMVDSNYFIRGYAIHGYPEVPTYAASHGCLRVPIPDAASIFAWVRVGTPVDVYDQGAGGSTHVRGNAGP